jgi:hypothetical protein
MLLGLFHAFNFPCVPLEVNLRWLVKHGKYINDRYPGLVAKRSSRTIFAWDLTRQAELAQLDLILRHKVEVVHITRGREDTLRSEDNYVSPERYDAVQRQVEEHHHAIRCVVQYEELLEYPLGVQYQLAKELELEIIHPWTEYPSFVPLAVHLFCRWQPRPIGAPKESR